MPTAFLTTTIAEYPETVWRGNAFHRLPQHLTEALSGRMVRVHRPESGELVIEIQTEISEQSQARSGLSTLASMSIWEWFAQYVQITNRIVVNGRTFSFYCTRTQWQTLTRSRTVTSQRMQSREPNQSASPQPSGLIRDIARLVAEEGVSFPGFTETYNGILESCGLPELGGGRNAVVAERTEEAEEPWPTYAGPRPPELGDAGSLSDFEQSIVEDAFVETSPTHRFYTLVRRLCSSRVFRQALHLGPLGLNEHEMDWAVTHFAVDAITMLGPSVPLNPERFSIAPYLNEMHNREQAGVIEEARFVVQHYRERRLDITPLEREGLEIHLVVCNRVFRQAARMLVGLFSAPFHINDPNFYLNLAEEVYAILAYSDDWPMSPNPVYTACSVLTTRETRERAITSLTHGELSFPVAVLPLDFQGVLSSVESMWRIVAPRDESLSERELNRIARNQQFQQNIRAQVGGLGGSSSVDSQRRTFVSGLMLLGAIALGGEPSEDIASIGRNGIGYASSLVNALPNERIANIAELAVTLFPHAARSSTGEARRDWDNVSLREHAAAAVRYRRDIQPVRPILVGIDPATPGAFAATEPEIPEVPAPRGMTIQATGRPRALGVDMVDNRPARSIVEQDVVNVATGRANRPNFHDVSVISTPVDPIGRIRGVSIDTIHVDELDTDSGRLPSADERTAVESATRSVLGFSEERSPVHPVDHPDRALSQLVEEVVLSLRQRRGDDTFEVIREVVSRMTSVIEQAMQNSEPEKTVAMGELTRDAVVQFVLEVRDSAVLPGERPGELHEVDSAEMENPIGYQLRRVRRTRWSSGPAQHLQFKMLNSRTRLVRERDKPWTTEIQELADWFHDRNGTPLWRAIARMDDLGFAESSNRDAPVIRRFLMEDDE